MKYAVSAYFINRTTDYDGEDKRNEEWRADWKSR